MAVRSKRPLARACLVCPAARFCSAASARQSALSETALLTGGDLRLLGNRGRLPDSVDGGIGADAAGRGEQAEQAQARLRADGRAGSGRTRSLWARPLAGYRCRHATSSSSKLLTYELATSLLPWAKELAHAVNTCSQDRRAGKRLSALLSA